MTAIYVGRLRGQIVAKVEDKPEKRSQIAAQLQRERERGVVWKREEQEEKPS